MRLCVHLEYFQREAGSLSQQDSQLSENEDVKGQEFFLSKNAKEHCLKNPAGEGGQGWAGLRRRSRETEPVTFSES